MKPDKQGGKPTPAMIGIVLDADADDQILVTKKEKKSEDKLRQQRMLDLDANIRKLQKKMRDYKDDHLKSTKIRIGIMELSEQVEDLKNEGMTEEKFWGLMALNDDEAFDYGRDTIKDGVYESRMELPYDQIPLFTEADWYRTSIEKPLLQVGGILRSGIASGAFIKASCKVTLVDEEEGSESEENEPQEQKAADTKWDKILEKCKEVENAFPFDLMKQEFLNNLSKECANYKVRLYLISA